VTTVQGWQAEAEARKDEPLLPELAHHLDESETFGTCLRHPLVYAVPYHPQWAWQCNDQYEAKTQAVQEAIAAGDWHTVIWLHERPWRLWAFQQIQRRLKHREYWELLGAIWVDSENIWQNLEEWREVLTSRRPGRRYMMSEDEREALAAMPEELTIHRGYSHPGGTRLGFSWTLSEDRADWFARRLARDGEVPVVLISKVGRADVIAYFTGRGEEEIVVDPRSLRLAGGQSV
jgi:hypothetical protein